MEVPYFSIITPTYNRANFLNNAIKSVIKQTFHNWEYIIIDDASTDNSYAIIESFKDNRIVYLKNEVNSERSASRNKCFDIARGKYICFLDSDDEYMENHLEVLYKTIKEKGELIGLFYTTSLQQINNGEIYERDFYPFDKKDKFNYIMKYTFNHNCISIHKNIVSEFRYDPILYCLEDIDLWLHVAIKYPIIQIHEYTNILHFHEGSFTDGDYQRFSKELRNFTYIFRKREFKYVLPGKGKNRLLSMCHYKLALRYENEKKFGLMYSSIIKSFYLYPAGYNGRTIKPITVMFLYHIPLLGTIIKQIRRLTD